MNLCMPKRSTGEGGCIHFQWKLEVHLTVCQGSIMMNALVRAAVTKLTR